MGGSGGGGGGGGRQIKNLSHLGAPSKATARKPVGGASRASGCRVRARRGTAAEDRIGSEWLKVFVKGVTEHQQQQQLKKS